MSTAQRFGFELRSQRNLLVARCLLPSHEDTNPSFTIYPDQRFHCFGCGATGDVIDLVAAMTHATLPDAIREMARHVETGREIMPPPMSKPTPKPARIFRPDTRALTKGARLYAWILRNHPDAEQARNYLARRGINPTARRLRGLRIGYCPDDGDLAGRLAAARMTEAEAARAGLISTIQNSKRKTERFAGRIVVSELSADAERSLYMTGRTLIKDPPQGRPEIRRAARTEDTDWA